VIKGDLPGQAQKMSLVAQAGADAGELFWFLGDHLIAQGSLEKPAFWDPVPGKWEMSVVDSRGRSALVTFYVIGNKPKKFGQDSP
jgi:membrane carboxypeptidase/penicillin-binding protein PbpC